MGVYPMLREETCFFLAADFDKAAWQDDAAAFLETCHQKNLPAALERSRSGHGGHRWFFFEEAIPATLARKLGAHMTVHCMSVRFAVPSGVSLGGAPKNSAPAGEEPTPLAAKRWYRLLRVILLPTCALALFAWSGDIYRAYRPDGKWGMIAWDVATAWLIIHLVFVAVRGAVLYVAVGRFLPVRGLRGWLTL